jgi:hypothetical protein
MDFKKAKITNNNNFQNKDFSPELPQPAMPIPQPELPSDDCACQENE